jgi:hypothetical protein
MKKKHKQSVSGTCGTFAGPLLRRGPLAGARNVPHISRALPSLPGHFRDNVPHVPDVPHTFYFVN